MSYEKILVPLDGSRLAETILPHVTALAARLGSELVLLRVIPTTVQVLRDTLPPGEVAASPIAVDVAADVSEELHAGEAALAQRYLDEVKARVATDGLTVSTRVDEGTPAAGILSAAINAGCDIIAMCSHGRTGIGRAVLGSVSDEVLRNARVPVLIVSNANA